MNVVKFGNVCSHLHWHLIPRYSGELCANKTPWELSDLNIEQVFSDVLQQRLSKIVQSDMRTELQAALHASVSINGRFFYSAAVVIRPRNINLRVELATANLNRVVSEFRKNPLEWETLLMRRNYDDGVWDHFGGCADGAEFPRDTLTRELFEEAGWKSLETSEFARHWRGSVLRGFCFVVMPADPAIFVNDLHPRVDGEVAQASWFSLEEIDTDERFAGVVRGRMSALAKGNSDFDCDDFFVQHRGMPKASSVTVL
jgi:8-oxo-dGTP pyrophosphatase MutT (NUDIX family)